MDNCVHLKYSLPSLSFVHVTKRGLSTDHLPTSPVHVILPSQIFKYQFLILLFRLLASTLRSLRMILYSINYPCIRWKFLFLTVTSAIEYLCARPKMFLNKCIYFISDDVGFVCSSILRQYCYVLDHPWLFPSVWWRLKFLQQLVKKSLQFTAPKNHSNVHTRLDDNLKLYSVKFDYLTLLWYFQFVVNKL